MTVTEYKNKVRTTLSAIYPKEEIDSFYFLLMEEYLGLKRIAIALNPNSTIEEKELTKLKTALKKLKQEIPIQYLVGKTEFYGLPFTVNANTLIPRPETEELVEWIISTSPNNQILDSLNNPISITSKNSNFKILDIGTGSGCIAISLAKNLPKTKVFALDISKDALKIAEQNAKLNKVSIEFIQGDILASTPLSPSNYTPTTNNESILSEQFDIIVSNPPYVRELEKKEIKNNVLENEPHLALFVKDENPLLFYDKIADFAEKKLKSNGQLFFEINQYLGKETVELLKQKGFNKIELRKDVFGNDRMICAVKNK